MLASVSDVKRYLPEIQPGDTSQDANLTLTLGAVDAYVKRVYKVKSDTPAGTSVTESFFNVSQYSILQLRDPNPNIQSVNTYWLVDAPPEILTPTTNYLLQDNGKVQLLFTGYIQPLGLEHAVAKAIDMPYQRVDVVYLSSEGVPAQDLVEAVAESAAIWWKQAEQRVSGMSSESIQGYSYHYTAPHPELIPDYCKVIFRGYKKRQRVYVV